jgi:hypothetical protein
MTPPWETCKASPSHLNLKDNSLFYAQPLELPTPYSFSLCNFPSLRSDLITLCWNCPCIVLYDPVRACHHCSPCMYVHSFTMRAYVHTCSYCTLCICTCIQRGMCMYTSITFVTHIQLCKPTKPQLCLSTFVSLKCDLQFPSASYNSDNISL